MTVRFGVDGYRTSVARVTWGSDAAQMQTELLRKLLWEMSHDMDRPEAAWQFFASKVRKHRDGALAGSRTSCGRHPGRNLSLAGSHICWRWVRRP